MQTRNDRIKEMEQRLSEMRNNQNIQDALNIKLPNVGNDTNYDDWLAAIDRVDEANKNTILAMMG
jgi:hypothetical protein